MLNSFRSFFIGMSAAALREQLKAKRTKQHDPRKGTQMTIKAKFDLINHL
jgi:hypothetical protein